MHAWDKLPPPELKIVPAGSLGCPEGPWVGYNCQRKNVQFWLVAGGRRVCWAARGRVKGKAIDRQASFKPAPPSRIQLLLLPGEEDFPTAPGPPTVWVKDRTGMWHDFHRTESSRELSLCPHSIDSGLGTHLSVPNWDQATAASVLLEVVSEATVLLRGQRTAVTRGTAGEVEEDTPGMSWGCWALGHVCH